MIGTCLILYVLLSSGKAQRFDWPPSDKNQDTQILMASLTSAHYLNRLKHCPHPHIACKFKLANTPSSKSLAFLCGPSFSNLTSLAKCTSVPESVRYNCQTSKVKNYEKRKQLHSSNDGQNTSLIFQVSAIRRHLLIEVRGKSLHNQRLQYKITT